MKQQVTNDLKDKPVLQRIVQKAVPILKGAGVVHASIFGSFVRGDNKRSSDVDFLIDTPKNMGLFDFVSLQIKLEEALKKKVDLGDYSKLKPRIRNQVLSEQIQIL